MSQQSEPTPLGSPSNSKGFVYIKHDQFVFKPNNVSVLFMLGELFDFTPCNFRSQSANKETISVYGFTFMYDVEGNIDPIECAINIDQKAELYKQMVHNRGNMMWLYTNGRSAEHVPSFPGYVR
jgi:hypothetical protein